MGKKNDKAPKPPDPVKTASAQTATNIGTALAEGSINRVNQVTPDGSLMYSQSGETTWRDPVSGKVYKIPNYTATTTLSPEQMRIKGAADMAEYNLADAARTMSGNINTDDFNVDEAVEAKLFDLGSKRLAPRLEEARRRAETQAANRGLRLGGDAYDRLMRQVSEGENDAYNQLALTGRDQAYRESRDEYDLPLNRIIALLSGQQVNQPQLVNTPTSRVANTDYAGLVNSNYNQKLAAWQQKQNDQNAMIGGLFGLAGTAAMYSDERLKTDIEKVGKTHDGQNIYSYRYKGGGEPRLGFLAQEVEKKHPEAVVRDAQGYRMVDYRKALRLGERARASA
jgi:hypothetical protein